MKQIYCSSYGNEGIFRMSFENGRIAEPVLFSNIAGTKYLAAGENHLVSLYTAEKGRNGVAILDYSGQMLASLCHEEIVSCFVSCYGSNIYTANFHEGTFSWLKYDNGNVTLEKKVKIQDKAGCHMIIRCGNRLVGFALNMDRIYVFNEELECVREIEFPAGTGPRHGVVSEDEKYLYAVSELSNEVFIIETGSWNILDSVRLSSNETSASAAIRLWNDTLYVTVRGIDKVFEINIVGEKLEIANTYSCGGRHPRDMIICESHVLCANMHSNSLTCVNEKGTISQVEIPEAVALIAI